MIRAIEDGVIAEFSAVLETVRLQFHDHAFGLGLVVFAGGDVDRVTVPEFGPQRFVKEFVVVRDDVVGRLEDSYGRPVVLLQFDDLQAGEFRWQFLQIFDIRTAPAVNRLIVVAHRGELRPDASEQFEYLILAGVGVLIFIHQQVTQAVLPFFGDVGMFAEKLDRQADQIVKIDRLIGFQRRFVRQIGRRRQGFVLVGRELPGGFRGDQGIFPVRDDGLQTAQGGLVDRLGAIADDPGAVGTVENGKARLVAQRLGLLAQNANTERVEGGYLQLVGLLAGQQLAHPLLHFPRRLVGEGDGGDIARLKTALLDEIGDFLRNHPRLARTRASEHEQGTVKVVNGFALLGIETGHQSVGFAKSYGAAILPRQGLCRGNWRTHRVTFESPGGGAPNPNFITLTLDLQFDIGALVGQVGRNMNSLQVAVPENAGGVHCRLQQNFWLRLEIPW